MRRKKKRPKTYNLKLAGVFVSVVGLLLLVSATFKAAAIIAKSRFDGQHRFTIAVAQRRKGVEVLSFAPKERQIVRLTLEGLGEGNVSRVGSTLKIPIDGTIETSLIPRSDVREALFFLTLSYRNLATNLTIVDLGRLLWFTRSIPGGNVTRTSLSLPLDDAEMDKLLIPLFADQTVLEEKQSIAIVNGTDVPGLGTRLARLVTNLGGNVVSVTTATEPALSSKIATEKETYTSKKLTKLLNYPQTSAQETGIADITITIGRDSTKTSVF